MSEARIIIGLELCNMSTRRVQRGASWGLDPPFCSSADKGWGVLNDLGEDLGFRVVQDPKSPYLVIRGSSPSYAPRLLRSAVRGDASPDFSHYALGFRVICDV